MGGSSGAAPEIFDSFQQPTNPETLTPNFGQSGPFAAGQPPPGFGGFPAPNGFSEFFTPGMPTMVSSPYVPSSSTQPAAAQSQPSMAAAPAPSSPQPITMFDGSTPAPTGPQPPSMGAAMFDTADPNYTSQTAPSNLSRASWNQPQSQDPFRMLGL